MSAKQCTKCEEVKDLSFFVKQRSHKTGFSSWCKTCSKGRRDAQKQYHAKRYKEWLLKNKDHKKAYNKQWLKDNLEHSREYAKQYWNNKKDVKKKHRQTDYHKNKPRFIANSAKRRAYKLKATPSWLNETHIKEILAFYILAKKLSKETLVKYHVDHIEPLKGEDVCGLHVPWNLRVVTAAENIS